MNEAGLAECEVRKLLDFICKSSSTWSVVAVAHRLSPAQAALAFAQHQKRMTGRQAADILKALPKTKAYGPAREGLVRKILRLPLKVWLGDKWFDEVWEGEPGKHLTLPDIELMKRTIKIARSPEFSTIFQNRFEKPQT